MSDIFEGHVRVAFVGSPLDDRIPAGFERVSADDEADVYHVRHDRLAAVRELRAQRPAAAIVVDLCTTAPVRLDRSAFAIVCEADVVSVGSARQARLLEEQSPLLAGRTSVIATPLDLERFAPDADLAARRRVHYSRFKRYHRLAPPAVLFAGPYTADCGLERALDAAYLIREELEDIRFAAIPFGDVDRRYLDRCERRALLLGHRGIVQWSLPDDDELPFWFGAVSVVVVAGESAEQPSLFAAAAARPIVAIDATVDAPSLATTLRELLGPVGVALGEERRRELVSSQGELPEQRAQLWCSAAFGAGAVRTAARSVDKAASASLPSSSTAIHPR